VILLDAYAILAVALDEPAADEVEALIRQGECAITTVNLCEGVDYCIRRAGIAEADARAHLSLVVGGPVRIVPVSEEHAWRGAVLRGRHYARRSCDVSLADCLLLAAAGEGDLVATADPSIGAVARAEGIGLVPLPDTRGHRP
jgi:PIN domain nuclease of toxin-antitoxin system